LPNFFRLSLTIPPTHRTLERLTGASTLFTPILPPIDQMPRIDDIFARHGAQENANGGIYISGATYGYKKKLEVAVAYHHGLEKNPPATIAAIAQECKVGQKFVGKIVNELSTNGRVFCPGEIERESRGTKITGFAATVVLSLYMEEPSRSKRSYRDLLFHYTGI
jgi:hypothetical protein